MSSSSPWEGTYQIGIVVRDLDEAVDHYERMGIGPFSDGPSANAVHREVFGSTTSSTRVRGKVAQMGPLEFELLETVRGPSVQQEALSARGEHVLHLCAYTEDLDAEVERMTGAGFPVISYGELDDGGRFAYFDTRQVGGLILEYFQRGPEHG